MIYAMSDIHGCIEEMKKQLEQINLEEDNRIVFLGDLLIMEIAPVRFCSIFGNCRSSIALRRSLP